MVNALRWRFGRAGAFRGPVAFLWSLFLLCSSTTTAWATIPFITDDTGTQGKGKIQIELFGEYGSDSEGIITAGTSDLSATLTYGIIDPLDIALVIPYQIWRSKDSDSVVKGDGIGDLSLEAKWKFYEKEGLSTALKPGLTIPTGDDQKGLGAGKVSYYLYLIASKEMNPWAFNLNLGYIRNGNKIDESRDTWRASVNALVEVIKNLRVGLDLGVETNPVSSSNTPLAYVLGGLIWSLRENLDIGLGVKGGLTKPETDIAVRGGITVRF